MTPAQRPLVDLLELQFTSLEELGSSLAPRDWHQPASLPGWSVFDIYAHIIGTESMLEGGRLPGMEVEVGSFDHVHNEIGIVNETWIEALSDHGPRSMLARYRDIIGLRMATLRALGPEAFAAETMTPVGLAPYWRFLQIRIFDCWMHEQDVREALIRPGNESGRCAEAAVDEAERALGFLIAKKAGAPTGSTITFELLGPVYRTINIHVGKRAIRVESLALPPTTKIALSSSMFMRIVGGRARSLTARHGELTFVGDLGLAQRIVGNLTFTP